MNGKDLAFSTDGAKGLTKREYFAAMALQGYIASRNGASASILAQCACDFADALIEALK